MTVGTMREETETASTSEGHTRECDEGNELMLQLNDPERGQGMFEYASDETHSMTVRPEKNSLMYAKW